MRAFRYAGIGAVLALGAPIGWLLLRALCGEVRSGVATELAGHALLYAYLLVSTMVAFKLFGATLGLTVERLATANRELSALTQADALTGVKNMRYFEARLAEEVARAERSFEPLALVSADLDHFKHVNDSFGHPVGDEVLKHVAQVFSTFVRAGDSICRVGGEEFAIICPGTSVDEARALAERIRSALERVPAPTRRGNIAVTASFGIAPYRQDGPDPLRNQADDALYAAKRSGRNRVEAYLPPRQVHPRSMTQAAC